MANKAKPIIKHINKQIQKQEQKSQNKFFLVMSFLFLVALLVSLMIPVYYVPLFKNISAKYGLSADIARKLTLLDLALNSLGIETPNMVAAFKQKQIEYEPDVFYTSRFEGNGKNRLINAKETYYHEYERTKKRPAEIAGIYQDGTSVSTPEIDGNLKGIRALPKDDFEDNSFTDFSYKKASANTLSKDEVLGSKSRQVRGSFDRQEGDTESQTDVSKKHESLPDFASSVYTQEKGVETQTLENSRMVKPLVSGQDFTVIKPGNIISKLVGDSSFTDTFASLRNFGGYEGALGYYVKDKLPETKLIDLFGRTGEELFLSYFYSNASVGSKYIEQTKHFSEIAFHGDEPQDEVLVAKGQKEDKVPTIDTTKMSPLELVLTVKRNMKECEDGRKRYEQIIGPLKTQYNNAKAKLKKISEGDVVDQLENVAKKGAPGSCRNVLDMDIIGIKTYQLRGKWNQLVDTVREKCKDIERAEINYAESCKMNYTRDPNKDDCNSLNALILGDGPAIEYIGAGTVLPIRCEKIVKWLNLSASKTFRGCGGYLNFPNDSQESAARQDCADKQDALFDAIDANIQLEPKPGFVFN